MSNTRDMKLLPTYPRFLKKLTRSWRVKKVPETLARTLRVLKNMATTLRVSKRTEGTLKDQHEGAGELGEDPEGLEWLSEDLKRHKDGGGDLEGLKEDGEDLEASKMPAVDTKNLRKIVVQQRLLLPLPHPRPAPNIPERELFDDIDNDNTEPTHFKIVRHKQGGWAGHKLTDSRTGKREVRWGESR